MTALSREKDNRQSLTNHPPCQPHTAESDLSVGRQIHTLPAGVPDIMNTHALRTFTLSSSVAALLALACSRSTSSTPSASERATIADSLKHLVTSAYDLSKPGVVNRLMSLYPEKSPVISANSGHATTTRAELQSQIETFWRYVGSNMRNPQWEWTSMHIDVLSRDAAVMTATYRIPHLNPQGMSHVIGGAWTAVFVNRGGRWVIIQEHLSDSPTP